MTAQIIKNMPAEEYHALKRFSASGIKKILVSAQDFWKGSWMNPEPYKDESDAMNLGSAYHTRILEGEKAFMNTYAVPPECDKRTKEGKATYAAWSAINANKKPIEEHLWKHIISAGERIESDATLKDYFHGGDAEVTVLWDDESTGVPMKARFDYIKQAKKKLNDLKTFSNSSGHDLERLIPTSIKKYKYHVQLAVYDEAYKMAFNEEPDITLFFQQAGNVNNIVIKKFPQSTLMFQVGQIEARKGVEKFAEMYRKFNTNQWFDDIIIGPLKDEDFPAWAYD